MSSAYIHIRLCVCVCVRVYISHNIFTYTTHPYLRGDNNPYRMFYCLFSAQGALSGSGQDRQRPLDLGEVVGRIDEWRCR